MAPSVKKRKVSRSETLQNDHDDNSQAGTSSSPTESATLVDESPAAGEPEAPKKTFKELGLIDSLCDACASLNYTHPTPIQAKAIPEALSGRDIIGLAETGSGKTAAFVLPILQSLLERPSPLYALILAPTRELAQQIGQQVDALGATISVRSCTIVGGLDMVQQAVALSKRPHIVVATPGRLLDHLEKTKGFKLNSLKYLVIDEGDKLLDMDFGPVIDKLLKFLPRERRTFLFSATISSKVESLQRASLRDPVRVQVSSSRYQTVSTLKQYYLFIPQAFKDVYLIYLLSEFAGRTILVFTRTVFDAQRISIMIRHLGFKGIPLHGQLNQSARLGALNKFKSGARDIMVATDVAARGLDISGVQVVLNYDLPGDSKTYIHRVGRTARAGRSGSSISMCTQYDLEIYARIEAALGKKLPEYPAPREEVMVYRERVEEAQRHSRNEMKNLMDDRGNKGSVLSGRKAGQSAMKRRRDNMDAEEG
ncbi:DEAD-domain-containing protein [Xylaria bambusicola]|uniref:DEAD-domain-containing protein n=1 Tax=Xylaria bambusicola TaxID=326684 RepID=UPI0020082E2A|nr:DEAD-domain-containing protein [Xylaria bambusicola]KAI0509324.1 DEAD-domain-containing protein [Xylaria bambusicola]